MAANIRIAPTERYRNVTITNNMLVGLTNDAAIAVDENSVTVNGLLMTSSSHPAAREAVVLLSPGRRRWWKRALIACARWLLRRAS